MIIECEHTRYDWEVALKKDPGSFDEVLVKDPKIAKRVTLALVTNKILFRKINYGCGVLLFVRNDKKV